MDPYRKLISRDSISLADVYTLSVFEDLPTDEKRKDFFEQCVENSTHVSDRVKEVIKRYVDRRRLSESNPAGAGR